MKNLYFFTLFCFLFFGILESNTAQVTISTMNNPASFFVDQLVGTGVTYSNPIFSNTGAAYISTASSNFGLFNNGSSVIGINSGIILSTGNVLSAPGPNSVPDISTNNLRGGDATLNTIISPTYDAMGLEFDFVPESNIISFQYVFASEEYNEYVGSGFNDVFGFFVTGGPEAYSNKNIAIVPTTPNTPVSINNINNGSYSQYYHDNEGGAYNLQYDGFTTILTATCNVTPCASYHMKIIIADVTDYIYDSGVFLESGSFTSPSIDHIDIVYSNPNAGGNTAMVEGCSNGQVTFGLTSPTPFNRNVPFTLSGTATYGTDYYTIPGLSGTFPNFFVTIPAGSSSTIVTIVPTNEGSIEGTETIAFSVQTNLCGTPIVQSGTLNILDNSTPFSSTITPTQNICLGNYASLGLNLTGGQTPISYIWNPTGYTTNPISVNPPANQTYTVTATDACGATTTGTTTVNVDNIPTVVPFPASQTFCSGESTNITLSSGVSGTTFNWTVSAGTNITGASSGSTALISQTLVNSGTTQETATYTVTPSANGCNGPPTDIIVYVNPTPTGTAVTTPVTACSGTPDGSITINATGGTAPLNYALDGGTTGTNNVFSNIGVGSHSVVISDAVGCQFTISNIDVAGNTGISITSIVPVDVNCFGDNTGSLTITAPGATQFSINNGTDWFPTNIFNGLPAGNYSVMVQDAGNCQDAQSVTISSPTAIEIDSTVTDMLCAVLGDATLTVSGGVGPYSYLWYDNSTLSSHSNLSNGSYLVTVTDANTCTSTTTVIIGYSGGNLNIQSSVSNVSCHGDTTGNISLVVQNGTSPFVATWAGLTETNLTLTGLGAGTYNVTVTDINGCTANSSMNIVEPSQILLDSTVINHTCGTLGSASVIPSGGIPGYLYYWSVPGSTPTINNLPTGTYTVTVTDTYNCSATLTTIVGVVPATGIGQVSQTNISCNGGSDGSATVIITNGIAPFSCVWQYDTLNTTNIANNLSVGNYPVTITDAYGACITSLAATITQPSVLDINLSVENISCNNLSDGMIVANGTGGTSPYQYHWSDNSTGTSISDLTVGTYAVTITDANNCLDSAINIAITNPTALSIITSSTNPTCFNDSTGTASASASGGTPPYNYAWTGGNSGANVTNLSSGNYVVTVTDDNLCLTTDIVQLHDPIAMIITDTILVAQDNSGIIDITVIGGLLPYTYNWSNGATTQDISGLENGLYIVTVTDMYSCNALDTFLINNPELPLIIPSVITPNNDGKNEDFEIKNIEQYNNVSVEIYNRWGDLLFIFSGTCLQYIDPSYRWDGKHNGKDLPMGSYVYIIKIDELDPFTGVVSIIR